MRLGRVLAPKSKWLYLLAPAMLAVAISAAVGRSHSGSLMFSDIATPAMADEKSDSQGACWSDIDGDGDQDVFVTRNAQGRGEPAHLWRNDGNLRFTDVIATSGLAGALPNHAQGCAFIDIDNDGDVDFYVTSAVSETDRNTRKGAAPGRGRAVVTDSQLFINKGDGTFEEAGTTTGLGTQGLRADSSDWADYDGDYDYDAFVATRGPGPDFFFEQTRPLSFRNVALEKGLANVSDRSPSFRRFAESFLGSWFDYDGDGDVDLLVAI